jgi:hypothetical protein
LAFHPPLTVGLALLYDSSRDEDVNGGGSCPQHGRRVGGHTVRSRVVNASLAS